MSDDDISSPEEIQSYVKIGIIATLAVVILTAITIFAYQYARKKSGTVVLPGGTTYLGPSTDQQVAPPPPQMPSIFTASGSEKWIPFTGKLFPYTFSYPETLSLVVFPQDPTDSVAIAFNNIPPQQNLMYRVSDIAKIEPDLAGYVNKPKIEYVKNWWKQYSGLKGFKSIDEFTNSKGMKGYKAIYLTHANETPNMDVFFEVPGNPKYMVWFSRSILEQSVFDKIIDSFYWDKTKPINTLTPQS